MMDYGLKCPKCGSRLMCGDAKEVEGMSDMYIIDAPVCVNYEECGTMHVSYYCQSDKIPEGREIVNT